MGILYDTYVDILYDTYTHATKILVSFRATKIYSIVRRLGYKPPSPASSANKLGHEQLMVLARSSLCPREPVADSDAPTLRVYSWFRRLSAVSAAETWLRRGAAPALLGSMLLAHRVDARLAALIMPSYK